MPESGAPPDGAFCKSCGHQTGAAFCDFRAFVHELLEGKRASFAPPLRIFLFFTILLFIVVGCRVNTTNLLVRQDEAEGAAPVMIRLEGDDQGDFMNVALPGFWPFTALQRISSSKSNN